MQKMKLLSRLIYKLFGTYTRIHIMDSKHQPLKSNLKIKIIPQIGDLIYFDKNNGYFSVIKVVHVINNRHEIWVMVQPIKNNFQNK